MARLARVVAVDVAHRVTQRGNGRQFILASEAERTLYLDLLRQALQHHPVSVIGYCLMSNHVHLVVIPHQEEALGKSAEVRPWVLCGILERRTHFQWHAWQGWFYWCPLGPGHLWEALRYAELHCFQSRLSRNLRTSVAKVLRLDILGSSRNVLYCLGTKSHLRSITRNKISTEKSP